MKKMRIVSGLMAMAMAAVSLGVNAFAADSVEVKIGKVEAKDGKWSVDVDLSSVPSTGLSSIDFAVAYDTGLKITDVTPGTAKTGAAEQEGELGDTLFTWKDTGKQIVLVWATGLTDTKYWVKEGTFVTISGTVDKDGDYNLKAEPVAREAYPGGSANNAIVFSAVGESGTSDYEASFSNGMVSVGTPAPETTEAPKSTSKSNDATLLGDANLDKKVTVGDAVLLARVAAEDKTANITEQGKTNGDVDGNGKINSDDVTTLLKFLAGMIDELG